MNMSIVQKTAIPKVNVKVYLSEFNGLNNCKGNIKKSCVHQRTQRKSQNNRNLQLGFIKMPFLVHSAHTHLPFKFRDFCLVNGRKVLLLKPSDDILLLAIGPYRKFEVRVRD
mmetsp:Transcript_97563/g.183437  ORF Transcript_97563/g.183437 Transcript_97563/m.183437 type:complete len:112 (-) Transcript_97563:183-518(-)